MKYFFFTLVLAFFTLLSKAQFVKGWVKDEKGPLSGATVIEKGMPGNGTSADEKGYFEINLVGKSKVIIVAAVGHESKEINISSNEDLNITLQFDQSSSELEDVVVVGYGRQKKVTLTGAVSSIKGEDIQNIPTPSLQNALSGRLPGFSSQQRTGVPGDDGAAFFVRGRSSPNGDNSPLILVDDIEYSYDQFSRLDANEIESVSILKDASTTAIFGIKGANGVVLVTTKRGKMGKPKVSARSEVSFSQPTIFPKVLDAYESALLYNQAQVNDSIYLGTPLPERRFSDEDLRLFQSGEEPWSHPNVNWKETLFRDYSTTTRTNIDISGGSPTVKYFISGGYLWQNGMLNDFGSKNGLRTDYYYKRYNYRSNLDIKASKTLDIRVDLYGNNGEKNAPNPHTDLFQDYINFRTLSPFAYAIYNPNGTFNHPIKEISPGLGAENNVIGRLTYNGYNRNFENNIYLASNATQKLDFITKGLSLKGVVSYASLHSFSRNMGVPDNNAASSFPSYSYDRATDTYQLWNDNTYRIVDPTLTYNAGNPIRRLNLQAFLNYDRRFTDHHFIGMLLINRQTSVRSSSAATSNYIPSNTRGYAARLGYDFKQKYLVEFNGAYNGSDVFAARKKYGFFPSGSVGWNITEESFMKPLRSWLSRWKIKGSYGIVGSDNIGSGIQTTYDHEFVYAAGNEAGDANYYPGLIFGTSGTTSVLNLLREKALGNDDVSWEKERKLNIGTELSFIKDKLSLNFDYFDHLRYDIIISRESIPDMIGVALPKANKGRVKNSGYEVELSYKDRVGNNLSYFINANYSYVKDEVLELDEPANLDAPWQQSVGQSMGQVLLYKWIGFYSISDIADPNVVKPPSGALPGDLKFEDFDGDGVITENDRAFFGRPNFPTTTFGLSFGGSYKKLSVSLLLQGARNFSFRARQGAIQAFLSNLQPIHKQAWTPELGDNAKYPRLSVNNTSEGTNYSSTFWLIPGDYLRLKTLEIGYSLPRNWGNKLKFQDAKIYVSGYNLLTWSKLSKLYQFDPEAASGNDRSVYPPQRTLSIGASLTF